MLPLTHILKNINKNRYITLFHSSDQQNVEFDDNDGKLINSEQEFETFRNATRQ